MVKSIPGLDSIRSRVVKARGNNLADAFQNLNMNELKKTNNMLAQDYKKRYSETEDLRAKLKIEREAVKSNLKQKFDNADGFWNKFYRQLDARKK